MIAVTALSPIAAHQCGGSCLETIEVVDPLLPTSQTHGKRCRGTLRPELTFSLVLTAAMLTENKMD
jgi:hypothetical protein